MKFYKVIKAGRNCLKNDRRLQVGDILYPAGDFMLKVATPTEETETTSMFPSEVNWDKEKDKYEELNADTCLGTYLTTLKPLIPHLPTGKKFKYFYYGNLKEKLTKFIKDLEKQV